MDLINPALQSMNLTNEHITQWSKLSCKVFDFDTKEFDSQAVVLRPYQRK